MQKRGLYVVRGHPPTAPLNVLTVDSGLMLIAISECVADKQAAISATRDVLWRTATRISPSSAVGKTATDVSLGQQLELLSIWEENRENGPLAGVCLLAAHPLFDIEPKSGDKEHSQAVGAIGAALIDDAWKVIATTKNAFGWKLSTGPIFSDDQ